MLYFVLPETIDLSDAIDTKNQIIIPYTFIKPDGNVKVKRYVFSLLKHNGNTQYRPPANEFVYDLGAITLETIVVNQLKHQTQFTPQGIDFIHEYCKIIAHILED